MYVCMYVWVYVCMYVCIGVCVCMCVCVCVCVYVCMSCLPVVGVISSGRIAAMHDTNFTRTEFVKF